MDIHTVKDRLNFISMWKMFNYCINNTYSMIVLLNAIFGNCDEFDSSANGYCLAKYTDLSC